MNSIRLFIGHLTILSCVAAGPERPHTSTEGGGIKPVLANDAATNHLQNQTAETKPQTPSDAKTASAPNSNDLSGLGPYAIQQIVNIKQLRKRIQENLQLTSSQASNIDRLCASFIDQTIKVAGAQQKTADAPTDKRQSGGLKEDHSPEWIAKIKAELNPDQVPVFEKVAKRWSDLKTFAPRSAPLQQLRRAIQDPEVGLTDAQREEFDALLTKTRKSIRVDGERPSPATRAETAEKTRDAIYEKLTPEQKAKMAEDLRIFGEEAEEYARLAGYAAKQGPPPDDGD